MVTMMTTIVLKEMVMSYTTKCPPVVDLRKLKRLCGLGTGADATGKAVPVPVPIPPPTPPEGGGGGSVVIEGGGWRICTMRCR